MEYPDVYNEKRPKARKDHACGECLGTIKKGEFYVYCWGIWGADAMTFKTCSDCQEIRDEIEKNRDPQDDPLCFEGLAEAMTYEDDPELVLKFIATKEKRGAEISKHWITIKESFDEDKEHWITIKESFDEDKAEKKLTTKRVPDRMAVQ